MLFPFLETALEELAFQKTPMSLFVLCVNLDVNLLWGGDHLLSLKEHSFQDFLIKEQTMKKQALWCAGEEEIGSHQNFSKLAQLTVVGYQNTHIPKECPGDVSPAEPPRWGGTGCSPGEELLGAAGGQELPYKDRLQGSPDTQLSPATRCRRFWKNRQPSVKPKPFPVPFHLILTPAMRWVFSFWLHHAACGTLVPWPGIEPLALPPPHSGSVES